MSQLVMDSGPGKVRYVVMGAIAAVFAAGIVFATQRSETTAGKPVVAAELQQTLAAAPAAVPAAPAPVEGPAPSIDDAAAPTTATTQPPADAQLAAATPAVAEESAPAVQAVPAPAAVQEVASAQPSSYDASIAATEEFVVHSQPVRRAERPRPAVRPPPPPALSVLQPWWRGATARDFDVEYVGQVANDHALVFRFSKNVAGIDAATRNIRVTDASGAAVKGQWANGANPYVLVYRGVNPGRYTVHIASTLASSTGTPLGVARQGPIYVQ